MKKFISVLLSMTMMFSLLCSSFTVQAADNTFAEQPQNSAGEQLPGFFSDEIAKEMDSLADAFGVVSVKINGSTATVSYRAASDCTLLIGVYADDGTKGANMLSFEKTTVTASQTKAAVAMGELPDSFYLRAYLIDTQTSKPLSKVYETADYTSSMKEFFDFTIDDFPSERVWNLDSNPGNNFMVLANGTKVINSSHLIRSEDIEYTSSSITVNNADLDSTIAALKKGDPFIFVCSSGLLHGIVSSISVSADGKKAVISYTEALPGDLFDYIRIDTSQAPRSAASNSYNANSAAYNDGNGYSIKYNAGEPEFDVSPFEGSLGTKVKLDKANTEDDDAAVKIEGEISGELGFSYEGEVRVYYSSQSKDEVTSIEVECTPKMTLGVNGSGSITLNYPLFDESKPIATVYGVPVVSAAVSLNLSASISAEGTAEVTFPIAGKLIANADFCSDKKLDFHKEEVVPSYDLKAALTVTGAGEFSAGISLLDVDVAKLAEVGLELSCTDEISLYKEYVHDENDPEFDTYKHSCNPLNCYSGTNSIKLGGSIYVESPILKLMGEDEIDGIENDSSAAWKDIEFSPKDGKITFSLFEVELLPERMQTFYLRLNPFKYEYGKCPNIRYKTYIDIYDGFNEKVVEGARVTYTIADGTVQEAASNDNGTAIVYLQSGKATELNIECDDYLPLTYTTKDISEALTREDVELTFKKAVTAIVPLPEEQTSPAEYVHGDPLRYTELKISYADGTTGSVPFFVNGEINEEIDVSGYDPDKLKTIQNVKFTYKKAEFKTDIKVIADPRVVESIVVTPPTNTDYYIKQSARLDLEGSCAAVHYTDGSETERPLTDCTLSGYDLDESGEQTVTVTFEDDHGNKASDTFDIFVNAPRDIRWYNYPDKTEYVYGEAFDCSGGEIVVSYLNHTSEHLPLDHSRISTDFDPNKLGEQELTVKFKDCTTTLSLTVSVTDSVSSCKVAYVSKTHYSLNESFGDDTYAILSVAYRGGVTEYVTVYSSEMTGFDSSSLGNKKIKIKYNDPISGSDLNASYTAKIVEEGKLPCGIIANNETTNYYTDSSSRDMVLRVTVIYKDGSTYTTGKITVADDEGYYYTSSAGYFRISGFDKTRYGIVQSVQAYHQNLSDTTYVMVFNYGNPQSSSNAVEGGYYGIGKLNNGEYVYKTNYSVGESFEFNPDSRWAVVYWIQDEYGSLIPRMNDIPDAELHRFTSENIQKDIPVYNTTRGYSCRVILIFRTSYGYKLAGVDVKVSAADAADSASVSYDSYNSEDGSGLFIPAEVSTFTAFANSVNYAEVRQNNGTGLKTAAFSSLQTNETYNYYVVKTENTADLLSKDNLLFVGQADTDENGNLSFSYGTITGEDGVIVLKAMTDSNPITAFVERLYLNILNRPSDGNKVTHIDNLNSGESACKVAFDFVFSSEFAELPISNEERVRRMYLTFLNREADPAGLADWTEVLNNGCSIGHIFYGFTQSNEFTEICEKYGINRGTWEYTENRDRSSKLTAFVSRLYTKAMGRAYDVNGLNDHTGNYLENRDLYQLAYNFIFSQEFTNKNLSNEEFVDVMYRTFFDREPDEGGKADWLDRMANQGYTREDVLAGFVGSQECIDLVARFGI